MTGGPASNRLSLSGKVVEVEPLRHTPAGVPIASGRLAHQSEQQEAGAQRKVSVVVDWLAAGRLAGLMSAAPLGTALLAEGFIAPRTRAQRSVVFHIVQVNLLGEGHGL